MTPYEQYLQFIAQRITINDADREVYTKDFDIIRDYVLNLMRSQDRVFNWFFTGPSLFGSYSNNVRINQPNEFDVIFKLSIPFSSYINVEQDEDRPGFVNLDFSEALTKLYNAPGYDDVYNLLRDDLVDWNNYYLRRTNLQRWINDLIEDGFDEEGNQVRGYYGDLYTLEYSKRGLAHTIYAKCNRRSISIDFIPAITFGQAEWMAIRRYRPFLTKCDKWYALPKPTVGPAKSRVYSFMICNPKAEHDLLLKKQNLKVVFRLLKSLRNQYEMDRLKSYFFTTAFLWEIEKQKKSFWNNPLSVILDHMLNVLSDYFLDGELPFFWDKNLNLLDILDEDEIEEYADKLVRAYNTLTSYSHQPALSYKRCASHFDLPE